MVITMEAVTWEQIRKNILKVTRNFKNLFKDFGNSMKKVQFEADAKMKVRLEIFIFLGKNIST